MSDLQYLFTDTGTFLSEEEEKALDEIEKAHSGFAVMERDGEHNGFKNESERIPVFNLIRKGCVGFFSYYNRLFILSRNNSRVRPITIQFNIYFPKTIKETNGGTHILNKDEKDKMAYCRGFIAKWVFKKRKITDKQYLNFVRLYTARSTYTMSIPQFLMKKFEKDMEKTGMTFITLTSELYPTKCPYCEEEFESKEKGEMVQCPKCPEKVLVR